MRLTELQSAEDLFPREHFASQRMAEQKTRRNRGGRSCILWKKQRVVMPVTRDARASSSSSVSRKPLLEFDDLNYLNTDYITREVEKRFRELEYYGRSKN